MTPTHAIFRQSFLVCQSVTNNTFDFLPDAQTKYPFVYVGEQQDLPTENFDMFGECTQTIHIYALRTQRGEIDKLSSSILNGLRKQNMAFDYNVSFKNHNYQIIPDNTDVQPLLHAIIDIRFSYVKKEK